jgi:alpha-beta hydrolase superfamily lysophospholipase
MDKKRSMAEKRSEARRADVERASRGLGERGWSKRKGWLRWFVVASTLGATSCTVAVGESALFPPRSEVLPGMPEGVLRRTIELAAADGVVLRGWYLEKPNTQRTVLFFYGNRSSVVSSTWSLHWLVEGLNANVVAFDYRGYGFSDGKASIDRIVQDALEIHRHTVDTLGRGALPMIVVGQSMGTASALHVAANRDVDAVVLLAPPGAVNDLLDAMRAQAPWYVSVEADASLRNSRVSPIKDAGRVHARTLFVSGTDDVLASPAAVARLTSACGARKKVACRLPGGHGDIRPENPDVRKCIAGFVLDTSDAAEGRASSGVSAEPGRTAP